MGSKFQCYLMPVVKLLAFVIFVLLCGIPFSLIEQIAPLPETTPLLLVELIGQGVLILMLLGGLLMAFRVFKQYGFENITIVNQNIFPGFLKGTLLGFLIVTTIVLSALVFGNVTFAFRELIILPFVGYFVFYILVAISEELLFRTFPLIVLAERYRVFPAILITSLLFGIAHYGNPGFNWLAMFNITLAGILLAGFTLQKRNVSWAIGIHFGWNFTQGVIFGYQVSGTPATGILVAKPVGDVYLSGGSFGIEGSVYCTIVMLLLIGYLFKKYKIEPVEEIVFNEEFDEIEEHELS